MPKMSVMGYEVSLQKQQNQTTDTSAVDKAKIRKAIETLKKYKQGKENLENQIIENEQWYKLRHWDYIRKKQKETNEPEPVTAYLFSTIANKHADAMDNFPEASMLPREEGDKQEAQNLSDIVPVVMERNEFKTCYDDAWWYKLKHGTVAYGVFWNQELENGLGDIDIHDLDLLNIYWEPGIKNIQDSPNLFVVSLVNNETLKETYKDILPSDFSGGNVIDIKKYVFDDNIDTTEKSVVVDQYYKKKVGNKTVVHMTKFVDEHKLGCTEDDTDTAQIGIYEHGKYPVIFDVLFPEAGSPTGFGYIHVIRNPQMYIDKLDQLISKNALLSGKQRVIVKDNGDVNVTDLLDYSKDVILTKGNIRDNFEFFQANPISPAIIQHREGKIAELKETSGANDFSRGEGGKGITAASAIMALQEAGNKLSRDMIQRSYVAFTKTTYMVIELIRQYYNEERMFRITGKNGEDKYTTYSNQGLQEKPLPVMYEGEEQKFKRPIFDIKVKPEKQSPFSRMAHNELAKELYTAGMFNPQTAQQALVALEMMQFEGKDTIIKMIKDNDTTFKQMQQMQQQNMQYQQQMQKMAMAFQKMTGEDLGLEDSGNGQSSVPQM